MDALSTLLAASAAANASPPDSPALGGMQFSLLLQAPAPAPAGGDPVSATDEVPDAQDAANLLPWINLLPRLMAANDAAPAMPQAPAAAPVGVPASIVAGTAAISVAADPGDAWAAASTENHELAAAPAVQADALVMSAHGFEPWPPALPQATAVAAPVHQAVVTSTPDSPQWPDEFSQQVVWTAREGLHSAEIKLHPQEFGGIAVHLEMDDGQARLSFSTSHVAASNAIEQSLPRLRELFAHEGLNLGQVQVYTQTAQDQSRQRQSAMPSLPAARSGEPAEPSVSAIRTVRRSGLLDDYA